MTHTTISGLDGNTFRRLRERAEAHGRTISEEIKALLEFIDFAGEQFARGDHSPAPPPPKTPERVQNMLDAFEAKRAGQPAGKPVEKKDDRHG